MLYNKHTRFHEVLTEFGLVTIDAKGIVKGVEGELTKEQEKKIGKFSGFKYIEDKPKKAEDNVKPIKVDKLVEKSASKEVKKQTKPATKRRGRPATTSNKKAE